MTAPLLFIHPYNHVLDELVPMGAVALMNRVSAPVVGRFAWELDEATIGAAGCVAMDLHWYFSVEAVRWIARDIKRLRPDLPIILGGITASFYARHLLETFPVDYVVQGDGEYAFPRLVEALLERGVAPPLPNVWTKTGPPPSRQPVRGEEYDENDYLTLDWFPTLAAHTRANHAEYAERPFWGRMDRYHPYVPMNRGCRFPCNGCFGSYQREVFGNGQVDRSAESLARILDGVEADPHLNFISLTAGTEEMARLRPWRDVFARKRALGLYVMHFCDLPEDGDLEMILGGFDRVCMDFTNPEDVPLPLRAGGWSVEAAEDRIIDIARAVDGMENVRLGVSFMSTAPHRFKDKLRAVDWETIALKENSEWTLPRPNLATLSSGAELPDMPVPEVARQGLTQAQRDARDAAKAAQAEGFRDVSRGHARYLLARALSPALHPVLDQSYLQYVDGVPVTSLTLSPGYTPEVQAFLDWYIARYRRWFVATLDAVEVEVHAVTPTEPGAGLRAVATWGARSFGRAWTACASPGSARCPRGSPRWRFGLGSVGRTRPAGAGSIRETWSGSPMWCCR